MRDRESPLQYVEAAGESLREPERMRLVVRQGEAGREPVTIEIRQVDGTLYHRMGESWGEIRSFNLAELMLLTPEQLHGIVGDLQELGGETLHGREVRHLRGRMKDLPVVGSGHETIDFSGMDRADLDLWIDRSERFIVKILIEGEIRERGEVLPIHMLYEVYDFGADVRIAAPDPAETVKEQEPRSGTQEDVDAKLRFAFEVPAGAFVSIYGATVNLITSLPLDEARTYAARGMRAAGFEKVEEMTRPTGEYYTGYMKEGRGMGVQVFQVSGRGATIQLGVMK